MSTASMTIRVGAFDYTLGEDGWSCLQSNPLVAGELDFLNAVYSVERVTADLAGYVPDPILVTANKAARELDGKVLAAEPEPEPVGPPLPE